MKIRILALLFLPFFAQGVMAQTVELVLVPESIGTAISNDEHIISDPVIIDNTGNNPGDEERDEYWDPDDKDPDEDEEEEPTVERNLGVRLETLLTPRSKFFRIPLSYSIGNFTLAASLPFYYDRSIQYSDVTVSATGFGDLQVRASYDIRQRRYFTRFQLTVKLPTGDENKQVDGRLVPLGTGSTDFILGNIYLRRIGPFDFYNNLSYRISGEYNRILKIQYLDDQDPPDILYSEISDFTIKNGNTLMLNSVLTYPLPLGLSLNIGGSLIHNSEGRLDRLTTYEAGIWDRIDIPYNDEEILDGSARQELFFVDANTGLSLNIFHTDIMASVQIPVITEFGDFSPGRDRKPFFLLKISHKLF